MNNNQKIIMQNGKDKMRSQPIANNDKESKCHEIRANDFQDAKNITISHHHQPMMGSLSSIIIMILFMSKNTEFSVPVFGINLFVFLIPFVMLTFGIVTGIMNNNASSQPASNIFVENK